MLLHPSTFCALYGACIFMVCLSFLEYPHQTLAFINRNIHQLPSLQFVSEEAAEYSYVLSALGAALGLIYIVNGLSRNNVFAINSIFSRLGLAATLAILMQHAMISRA